MAKKKKKSEKNKEFYWMGGAVVGLVVLYLVLSVLFNSLGKVEYEGLVFVKEKLGEIPIYHYTYFFENKNNVMIQYNLYIRHDPRELDVPVMGEIHLPLKKTLYISVNATEELSSCEDSNLAVGSLAAFLANNDYMVKGATTDKNLAKEINISYITCDNRPSATVVLIQEGNETSIRREDNCYVMSVANCEILKTVEKFEIQTIIDAKKRMAEE